MPARLDGRSFLVVTADDFGLRNEVNEAVERASREGVLTAASLMVGERAVHDAVRRAKRLPNLSVGLHVVLADGFAVLPPDQVPDLADPSGRMSAEMLLRGVRYFALPSVRRQLAAEIRAQFMAFERTGLPLDHVNVHKHYHLHPTILALVLQVGREFGAPPIRLPREPGWFAALAGRGSGRIQRALLAPWVKLMQHRIDSERVGRNDHVFGIAASGAMTESRLLCALSCLPPGINEIYLHPAISSGANDPESTRGYRHVDELAALLSPRIRDAVVGSRIARGGYREATAALSFSHQ
jgi:hopanoid biosynthesis associated protein HpnK